MDLLPARFFFFSHLESNVILEDLLTQLRGAGFGCTPVSTSWLDTKEMPLSNRVNFQRTYKINSRHYYRDCRFQRSCYPKAPAHPWLPLCPLTPWFPPVPTGSLWFPLVTGWARAGHPPLLLFRLLFSACFLPLG